MTTREARELARIVGLGEEPADDLAGLRPAELLELEEGLRYELRLAAGRTVEARNRKVRRRETRLAELEAG